MSKYYIGIMCGTSLDSIDISIASITSRKIKIKGFSEYKLDHQFKDTINMIKTTSYSAKALHKINLNITNLIYKYVKHSLDKCRLKPEDIIAIGFPGITLNHRPDLKMSTFIGDPKLLSQKLKMIIISDFRQTDIDAGGQGAANYVGSVADGNGVTYQMPAMDIMGATVTGGIDYSFQGGSDSPNDGTGVARDDTWGNAYGVGLTVAYDALSVGAFVSEREHLNPTNDKSISDEFTGSWNVKYSMGPVSIGYSEFHISSGLADNGSADTTTAAKTVGTTSGIFDGDMMSIAFNVNDDLSLSWSEMTATHDSQQMSGSASTATDVDEKHESIQMAYSMGAMSIKAYKTEITNPNFDEDAESITKNEIALGLSF